AEPVDENPLADIEGRLHRLRRDAIRLDDEGLDAEGEPQRDRDDDGELEKPRARPGLVFPAFRHARSSAGASAAEPSVGSEEASAVSAGASACSAGASAGPASVPASGEASAVSATASVASASVAVVSSVAAASGVVASGAVASATSPEAIASSAVWPS